MPDLETTPEDMRRAVDRAIVEGVQFRRVTISGGEPVVSKHLQGVINELQRMPGMRLCRVLTNGLNVAQARRDAIRLPDERFSWVPSLLDDSGDARSGKNKRTNRRYRRRIHVPFWISPVDHGLEGKWEQCRVRKLCGRGYDGKGYTMCGQAPILGPILGIDPYKAGTILEQTNIPIPEICRHCLYGLHPVEGDRIAYAALRKEIPSVSPTYAAVFGGDPYGVSPGLPQPADLVQITLP